MHQPLWWLTNFDVIVLFMTLLATGFLWTKRLRVLGKHLLTIAVLGGGWRRKRVQLLLF